MVSAVNTGVPSTGGRVNSPGYEQQGDFTYFGPTSDSVLSHLITVHEVPLLLLAFNLVGSDTVKVFIATQTATGITVSQLVLNTREVELSAQNNALLLDLPGVYRLQISGGSLGTATVVGQETNFSYASYGLAAYANSSVLGIVYTSGIATLAAGQVVVNTTKVTANSRIFLTEQTIGTVTAGQGLWIKSRVPGTSFTIGSAGVTDTSTVAWLILEP